MTSNRLRFRPEAKISPVKTSPTKTSIVNRAIWESIQHRPNNTVVLDPDWVQITTHGVPAPHMNGVYRCEKPELTEAETALLVQNTVAHYKALKSNFRWKTCSTTQPKTLRRHLLENGMVLKDLLFGFYIDTAVTFPKLETAYPSELSFKPLTRDNSEDWLEVQKTAWGVPPQGIEYLRGVIAREFETEMSRAAVPIAYWNGSPVGTGGLQRYPGIHDYVYLAGAAVAPEYRGRGIYKALIAERLKTIKALGIPAVIHCVSTTSAPICERLGFEKVCEIESFELA